MRWSQLGFGRTSTTSTSQSTPRNLFGFKDGTANVKAEQTEDVEEHVWVGAGDDAGARLAGRRVVRGHPSDQHDHRGLGPAAARRPGGLRRPHQGQSGAPLSGGTEFTEPDFSMPGSGGPVIAVDAHVRVVHPDFNDGVRMLRRGYNFVDGSDPLGGLDAGLFFVAFVRDPDTHFIPVQNQMAKVDALMEYLKVTGSALFAVPPGIGEGEYVGQALFG